MKSFIDLDQTKKDKGLDYLMIFRHPYAPGSDRGCSMPHAANLQPVRDRTALLPGAGAPIFSVPSRSASVRGTAAAPPVRRRGFRPRRANDLQQSDFVKGKAP